MKSDKLAGKLTSTFLEGDAARPDISPQREFNFARDEARSTLQLSLQTEYGTMILGGGDGDVLRGGAGPDRVLGWAGDDRLFGGAENDKLFGGTGNDALFGGAGQDRLKGGDGGDRLFGGRGADRIQADGSDKLVRGGGGQDKVVVELAGETGQMTRLFGGAGSDKLVLKIDYDAYGPDQAAGVLADLAALAAQIDAGSRSALTLKTLGIKVKGFEKLALRETGDRPVAAADDEVVTGENDPIVFSPLANDAGAAALARIDGQEIEIGDVISLAAGLLEIGADGSVTFTPNGVAQRLGDGEQAEDSFTYQAVSGAGVLGPEATVRIVIEGASDPVIILPDAGVPNSGASGAPLIISGVAIDLPQNESGVVEVTVSTEDGEIALGVGKTWGSKLLSPRLRPTDARREQQLA